MQQTKSTDIDKKSKFKKENGNSATVFICII